MQRKGSSPPGGPAFGGAREKIKDFFQITGSLAERLFKENTAGTKEDYREIKKVLSKVNKMSRERWECSLIKADLATLKQSCQDLTEDYISPKIKNETDVKYPIIQICCIVPRVKQDKDLKYYCDYCWEDESSKFLDSLQKHLLDEFNKLRLTEKHFDFDFNNNSPPGPGRGTGPPPGSWKKLRDGKFSNQDEIKQVYQKLLEELRDTKNNEREREQKWFTINYHWIRK